MKKFIYCVGFSLLSLGVYSCSEDDVEEITCDVQEEAEELLVEEAIDDFEEDQEGSCQELIDAIDSYRALECTDDSSYTEEYVLAQGECIVEEIVN